jgi:hypothetical protein
MFEHFSRLSNTAARDLRVRSGLNPMLWLCAIALPTCLAGAYMFRIQPVIEAVLITVGVLPIIIACLGFGYFAIRNPEKLQSEDYQIRHEAIQMLHVKAEAIAVSTASLEAIATGVIKQLESKGGEKVA